MKKKKLLYVPGIISIIGLPVLLFFLGPPDPVNENCVTLTLAPGIGPVETGALLNTSSTLHDKKSLLLI